MTPEPEQTAEQPSGAGGPGPLPRREQHAGEQPRAGRGAGALASRSSRSTTSWTCSSAGCSSEPRAFRELFISDGMAAVAWEFQQPELGPEFVQTLWAMLLRDDDSSTVLMRFVWDLPLGMKRKFIRGHRRAPVRPLPDVRRAVGGLAGAERHPAVHPRGRRPRAHDFGLVNQGYLGYMGLGYTAARGRPVRVARGAARQAVRGEAVRARRLPRRAPRAQGRLPGLDPHPAGDRPDRQGPLPRGAGADGGAATRCPTSPAACARRSCSARACACRSCRSRSASWSGSCPSARSSSTPRATPRGSPACATRGRPRPSRRWRSSARARPA